MLSPSYFVQCRFEIGQSIIEKRKKLGLSQKDLAEALKISPANLCRIEKGLSNYTIDTLSYVCSCLNLDIFLL